MDGKLYRPKRGMTGRDVARMFEDVEVRVAISESNPRGEKAKL